MNSIFILNASNWLVADVIAIVVFCVVMRLVQKKRICITQAVAAVLLATYLFLIFCSTVIARPNLGMHSYQLHPFWSYKEVIEMGRTDKMQARYLRCVFHFGIGGMSDRAIANLLRLSKDAVNKYVNEYDKKRAGRTHLEAKIRQMQRSLLSLWH